MKLFRFNPTIRETNRYLSKTVDELSKKHGGVSNEEFEKELVAVTGIGWKQVKNYKNHPKPSHRLADNTLVLKFVVRQRSRDKWRKVRLWGGMFVVLISVVGAATWVVFRPKAIETFGIREIQVDPLPTDTKIESRVFFEIPPLVSLIRVGPIGNSHFATERFVCQKVLAAGLESCELNESISEGVIQVSFIADNGLIRRFSVMTTRPVEVKHIRIQLAERVDKSLAEFQPPRIGQLFQQEFHVGDERVLVIATAGGPRNRPSISVTVSM